MAETFEKSIISEDPYSSRSKRVFWKWSKNLY